MGPLLAALALPLAEIAVFILVGGWIGVWPVLGLVFVAMLAGVFVLRGQGAGAMSGLRRAAQTGADPGPLLARSAMRVFAGLLLLLPGFLTDLLALALLLPVTQGLILARLRARFPVAARSGTTGGAIIEGTFEDLGPGPAAGTADGPGTDATQGPNPTHRPSGWTRH